LPENLRENATGEALQAIVDLDLDELIAVMPPRSALRLPTARLRARLRRRRYLTGHNRL
jgi:hypothetical protein